MNKKYIFVIDKDPQLAIQMLHDLGLNSPEHFLATTPTGANIFERPEIHSENLLVFTSLHATWDETIAFATEVKKINPNARVVFRSSIVCTGDILEPVFNAALNKQDEKEFLYQLCLVLTR